MCLNRDEIVSREEREYNKTACESTNRFDLGHLYGAHTHTHTHRYTHSPAAHQTHRRDGTKEHHLSFWHSHNDTNKML